MRAAKNQAEIGKIQRDDDSTAKQQPANDAGMITIDHRELAATRTDKCAEVAAFVRQGMDVNQACRIVGISRRAFNLDPKRSGVGYLPTPAAISEATAAIRAGRIKVSARSAKRWQELRTTESQPKAIDAFDLAGRIDDDDCQFPHWWALFTKLSRANVDAADAIRHNVSDLSGSHPGLATALT